MRSLLSCRAVSCAGVVAVACAVASGCGSSDPKKPLGAAGSAGDGGGVAGASGSGGTAGTGGNAGASGTGGTAGIDGGAGADAGAGAAGMAGADAGPSGPPALYPQNGANWNDYVKNDGTSITGATDTACDPASAGTGPDLCLHGGELRELDLPALSSCTNVTVSDGLGAFDWTCDDSTGTVRAISTGLKTGKYLSDLIDWTASPPTWKDNSVTATDGTNTATTPPAVWWDNPVVDTPAAGSLSTASAIYVFSSDASSNYTIDADHIGFVVKPGATLSAATATDDLLFGQGHPFLWIEGKMSGGASAGTVHLIHPVFSVGRDLDVTGSSTRAILVNTADNSKWSELVATDNAGDGITLGGSYLLAEHLRAERDNLGVYILPQSSNGLFRDITSRDNTNLGMRVGNTSNQSNANDRFEQVLVANNARNGLEINYLNQSSLTDVVSLHNGKNVNDAGISSYFVYNSLFSNVVSIGSPGHGFEVNRDTNNVLANVLVANNGNAGMYVSSFATSLVFLGITSVNNNQDGLLLDGTNHGLVMNAAVANNGRYGVEINQASNVAIDNLGVADNLNNDVYLYVASDSVFSGLLQVGSATGSCNIYGGTNPGLNASCANQAASTAALSTGHVEYGMAGEVTIDDTTNTSDTNGTAGFASITDWSGFDRRYRGWGADGPTFPDPGDRGACVTGQTCRIWDFDLLASDTTAARALVAAPADGNASMTQTWTASTSAQCALVPGATWDATGSTCTSKLLANAEEVIGDGNGNDNGLCESGETCLVMPNLGSYQGHGAPTSAGSIGSGGTITGVTLMKYTTNGY